jgi:hypothetical protein
MQAAPIDPDNKLSERKETTSSMVWKSADRAGFAIENMDCRNEHTSGRLQFWIKWIFGNDG